MSIRIIKPNHNLPGSKYHEELADYISLRNWRNRKAIFHTKFNEVMQTIRKNKSLRFQTPTENTNNDPYTQGIQLIQQAINNALDNPTEENILHITTELEIFIAHIDRFCGIDPYSSHITGNQKLTFDEKSMDIKLIIPEIDEPQNIEQNENAYKTIKNTDKIVEEI